MKKIFMFLVLMTLVLIAGCANQEPSAPQGLEKTSVLLDWTPNTNHTGVYVAQQLGYFDEEGLEVEIVLPGTGSAVQLVASNQADFAFSYQEEVTIARTQGLPIIAVAAVIQHNTSGFAAPTDRNINNPSDFENKRYGGWGSPAEEAMLKALMNGAGADFSTVEMVNIGSADFFSSVQRDIDFAWIFWGWTGIEAGLRDIPLDFIPLKDYNEALDFYSPVLVANEAVIGDNPDKTQRFLRAVSRGYEYAILHPQEAAEIMMQMVPELNRELVMESQTYLAGEYQSDAVRWGEMSENRWESYAAWMYSQGLIDKPLEAKEAFSNRYLPENK